jgi:hypothetical protein
MSYRVAIPAAIKALISSWGLMPSLEQEVYRRLRQDLAYGHETTCFRLAAPSPTYVFNLRLEDPAIPVFIHWFTFHLTYGKREATLYVRHCTHRQTDRSQEEEE